MFSAYLTLGKYCVQTMRDGLENVLAPTCGYGQDVVTVFILR